MRQRGEESGMTVRPRTSLAQDIDLRSARSPHAPWALAIVGPGLFFRGFDNPMGQAAACLLASLVLAGLVLSMPPPPVVWRAHIKPLRLLAMAFAWLLIVAVTRIWLIVPDSEFPLAPDLFAPKFLGTLAGFWALVTGLLCSRPAKLWLSQAEWILVVITLHAAVGLGLSIPIGTAPLWEWSLFQEGRFVGLLANANVTACMCGAACILAWSNILDGWDDRPEEIEARRIAASLLALAINAIAVTLTASRLPVLLTIVAMGLLAVIHARGRKGRMQRIVPWVVLAGGAILIIQAQLTANLFGRISVIETDVDIRWTMWAHFAEAIPAALWTGYGSGSLASLNFYTMTDQLAAERLWMVNSPHNILIQLLLVGGLPYLLLITAGGGLIARDILRAPAWRRSDVRFTALVFAAAVVLLDGAFDIALDVPASVCLFAMLTGLAWGHAVAERSRAAQTIAA